MDWNAEFQNRNVTESWQVFQKQFVLLCDKYVPIRKNNAISEWKNNWITKTTIKEIKKQEKAWISYKKTESNMQYRAYKTFSTGTLAFQMTISCTFLELFANKS